METVEIVWQRLVVGGQTCGRCGETGEAVLGAVETLTEALRPLGIEVVLRTVEIDQSLFDENPTESNRILVAGKDLESWVGATTGQSRCCSVCGDHECRTVDVDGIAFEAVPEWLIVKAALLAAIDVHEASMPSADRASASCSGPSCGTAC